MSKRRRAADYDHTVVGFVVHLWLLGHTHRKILRALSHAGVKMSRTDLRRLLDNHCTSMAPRSATADDLRAANHMLHQFTHGRYGAPAR